MTRPSLYSVFLLPALLMVAGCGVNEAPEQTSDFAVLAQSAEGYTSARPGYALEFPRDHGPHPDYRIEWWYLTANLQDSNSRHYGAQWTLFRVAVQPPGAHQPGNAWQSSQVYMAHFAITSPEGHVAFQRYARGGEHGGISRSGARNQPFAAWIDDWVLSSTGSDWLPMAVRAQQGNYSISLELASDKPLILQGDAGFSQKHPAGGGSFYYSQPFLTASGELELDGQRIPVSGLAWLDREWSSQFLQGEQVGWDWFSLHLESGEKLMLFQLRQRPGDFQTGTFRHGVLISPQGGKTLLKPEHIIFQVLERTPVAGRNLPMRWRIELPQIERILEIGALHNDQWMNVDFPYWEGAVTVNGSGPQNSGRGYMELTGYAAD